MSVQDTINAKLSSKLQPLYLQIDNESHMHSGPATESHFKVIAVSTLFEGMSRVKRHQCVYGSLCAELANGVHALALHLFSPSEWDKESLGTLESPACRGGSK